MRHPATLNPDEQQHLKTALASCPELNALHQHIQSFAQIMTRRNGRHLSTWVHQVRNQDLPSLKAFATGLGKDWNAVTAGLTLDWNSGMVEGTVTKIKMLKRQTYGRASPALLRKRALLT